MHPGTTKKKKKQSDLNKVLAACLGFHWEYTKKIKDIKSGRLELCTQAGKTTRFCHGMINFDSGDEGRGEERGSVVPQVY